MLLYLPRSQSSLENFNEFVFRSDIILKLSIKFVKSIQVKNAFLCMFVNGIKFRFVCFQEFMHLSSELFHLTFIPNLGKKFLLCKLQGSL